MIQEDRKINPNAELNIKIIKKEKEKKVVVSTVGLQESYHITNFLNYQLIFFGYPTMVDGVWPINPWAKGLRLVLKAPP